MDEQITVNDGRGFLDSGGLIDSLIADCNELPKDLFNGQNVRFCQRVVRMVQKLAQLQHGIKTDIDGLNKQIEELTEKAEKGGD